MDGHGWSSEAIRQSLPPAAYKHQHVPGTLV
jgi:hypothetical protein